MLNHALRAYGRLPKAFRQAASADAVVALGSELPGRLVARITEHAVRCVKALDGA